MSPTVEALSNLWPAEPLTGSFDVGDVALSNREKSPIYGYHDRKDDYRIVDHDNDDYDQHRRQGVTNWGKVAAWGKTLKIGAMRIEASIIY